jgi:hypothetical protein
MQFGGGRVIRPGDILETDEEKAAKEERTKTQLAAYKKKYGLNIDPKLKSECEEVNISFTIQKYYCHHFLLLSMCLLFLLCNVYLHVSILFIYFIVIDGRAVANTEDNLMVRAD